MVGNRGPCEVQADASQMRGREGDQIFSCLYAEMGLTDVVGLGCTHSQFSRGLKGNYSI